MGMTEQRAPVVLSPHLDDAVLSAWHVMSANQSGSVVTLFAGVPQPGFVTDLDRAHNARESAAWLERRRVEDRAALAVAGWEPVHLDFLEAQFAAWEIPELRAAIASAPRRFVSLVADEPRIHTDPDALVDALASQLHPDATVYGPVGIGGHPDHRDLASATVRLSGRVRTVRLYADSPYFAFRGLPSRVQGGSNHDADRWIADTVLRLIGEDFRVVQHFERLDTPAFERKLEALRRYTTEFPLIVDDLAERGGTDLLRHEIWWELDHGE
jgi:LmbE family N-acetylglucosaminyl deacetylase